MKTVIDKNTGQVKYCFFEETSLAENEIIIDAIATGNFYNLATNEFYDNDKLLIL
jgi:hypothetical protein